MEVKDKWIQENHNAATDSELNSVLQIDEAQLIFPNTNLKEFVNNRTELSILKWISGKRGSGNLAIYGENLASLAAIKTGFGLSDREIKVDIIYIDPPYNVGGNQGYKNTWKGVSENERDWAGNHGAFLDFMEPRLKIGHSLLTDEGVMFVSICDGEFAHLKILMNQIFGESNEITTFIWNKNQGSSGTHATDIHEYILCYARNKSKMPPLREFKPSALLIIDKANSLLEKYSLEKAQEKLKKWIKEQKKAKVLKGGEAQYNLIHPTNKRVFQSCDSCAQDDHRGKRCRTPLIHPQTQLPCPVPKNGWKWKQQTLDKLVHEGKICFGKDHTTIPRIIRYLDEHLLENPRSVISMASTGKNDLPPNIKFSTPKPVKLIEHLLSIYPKKNYIVLDYFAGSGTTAQAAYELNKKDNGDRKWIMIEEMGSTFHKVMIPRIDYFDHTSDYSIFNLETKQLNKDELINVFQKYSFDFFSAYHKLDESNSIITEGLQVIGFEENLSMLVAITIPPARKDKYFFEKELSTLKKETNKYQAKNIILYTVQEKEEPWIGNDKSIMMGTTCNNLKIIKIPEELINEWREVLAGLSK
ncbi:site-specific DNA-methyltransferase [Legionella pneumophila]|uniref:site-specific DNA-methyltransferase n=1 Tax=Legionella pneumophila TaxID=446 RepID=UPI0022431520|nr:site-specific DNA-methyltransferase [Legionella pneumophila]MCW8468445.1 site-specific DNA-methyltransferase [Legionella pneumophila]